LVQATREGPARDYEARVVKIMGSKAPSAPSSPLDQGKFREFRRRKSGEYRIVEGLGVGDNLGKREKLWGRLMTRQKPQEIVEHNPSPGGGDHELCPGFE
jgi:hypothetical protein